MYLNFLRIAQNIQAYINAQTDRFQVYIALAGNEKEYQAVKISAQDTPILRGVFIPTPGEVVPIEEVESCTSGANLIIACTDEFKAYVLNFLTTWASSRAGQVESYTSSGETIYYLINANTPNVGAVQILDGIGQGVTISVQMTIQFIAGGVIGNVVKWKLDGNDLPDLMSTIEKNRMISTDARENEDCLSAVACAQSLSFRFSLPYVNRPAITSLVNEALSPHMLKTRHVLSYYDGVTILSTAPVTYDVIAQAISLKNQKGTISSIDVVFTIVAEE